jgi:hypothetical protein
MERQMIREPLTKTDKLENALREIAASAAAKGGEWASEQAFSMLEFIDSGKRKTGFPHK